MSEPQKNAIAIVIEATGDGQVRIRTSQTNQVINLGLLQLAISLCINSLQKNNEAQIVTASAATLNALKERHDTV